MYLLNDYDYHLPESLIAQKPLRQRDRSRLLQVPRQVGHPVHGRFGDLPDWLRAGDVLVLNDTRVIPGRLSGHKASGGKVEALILDYARGVAQGRFNCLIKSSKRPKAGQRLLFENGVEAIVSAVNESTCILEFAPADDFARLLETIGHVPLPPYIRRGDEPGDRQTYQTVFARHKGAIAAPTAGLHFTPSLLDDLRQKGICTVYITLHVGYGTFEPVRVDDIRRHRMHAEWFSLSPETARTINEARRRGGRVIATGTTCVRTLEFCAAADGSMAARSGMCDLFIFPPYSFKIVDAMITNFHLPKSTLMMLVSAFAGRENILAAYAEAVRAGYRFFSYGDAMLII